MKTTENKKKQYKYKVLIVQKMWRDHDQGEQGHVYMDCKRSRS